MNNNTAFMSMNPERANTCRILAIDDKINELQKTEMELEASFSMEQSKIKRFFMRRKLKGIQLRIIDLKFKQIDMGY